jgi:DNA-binding Lrp family transcriptional regulator
MALLQQWHRQRPWLIGGLIGLATGIGGLASTWVGGAAVAASGSVSTSHEGFQHPLHRRIIATLERKPGLPYRSLQRELNAANGTLRHHLDILIAQGTLTVVSVNGRSCHYAGAPAQIEVLRGTGIEDEQRAAQMIPTGLSTVQKQVVARLAKLPMPASQAEMSRDLGRSRASVHSAVTVLRRRGILNANKLDLAPHLIGLREGTIDYDWLG